MRSLSVSVDLAQYNVSVEGHPEKRKYHHLTPRERISEVVRAAQQKSYNELRVHPSGHFAHKKALSAARRRVQSYPSCTKTQAKYKGRAQTHACDLSQATRAFGRTTPMSNMAGEPLRSDSLDVTTRQATRKAGVRSYVV